MRSDVSCSSTEAAAGRRSYPLDSFSAIHQEVNRVHRAFQIFSALGVLKSARERTRQGLEKIVQDFRLETQSEETAQRMDAEIAQLPPQTKSLYSFRAEESIDSRIKKIRDDLLLINVAKPVTLASQGLKSLTLISDYTYGVGSTGSSTRVGHVIKTADVREPFCNELYEALFKGFRPGLTDPDTGAVISYGILVPQVSSVDFERLSCEGEKIDSEQANEVQKKIQDMASRLQSDKKLDREMIMFQEKILGLNFYDFVEKHYLIVKEGQEPLHRFSLEERMKLYERLGRLYEFDQWFGNLDRLGNPQEDGTSYSAKHPVANAGNIMIQSQEGVMSLWAIDNEISPELMAPGEENNRYIAYLKDRLASPEAFEESTQGVIFSLFEDVKEHISQSAEVAQKGFSAFSQDLGIGKEKGDLSVQKDSLAYRAISKGRKDALKALRHSIIPNWKSDYMESLMKKLTLRYPEKLCAGFMKAQSERFAALSSSTMNF